jgi:hypothetical protein
MRLTTLWPKRDRVCDLARTLLDLGSRLAVGGDRVLALAEVLACLFRRYRRRIVVSTGQDGNPVRGRSRGCGASPLVSAGSASRFGDPCRSAGGGLREAPVADPPPEIDGNVFE